MNGKFRVWDKEINDYVCSWDGTDAYLMFSLDEGDSSILVGWKELDCDCNPDHPCGGCVDRYMSEPVVEGGRFVIEKYTGLKDVHGKEIYDGDVLQKLECFRVKENQLEEFKNSHKILKIDSQPSYGFWYGKMWGDRTDVATTKRFPVYWLETEKGYDIDDLQSPEDWIIIGNVHEISEEKKEVSHE